MPWPVYLCWTAHPQFDTRSLKFKSSFCLMCEHAGWLVVMWRGGWVLFTTGSRPFRRRRDSLTWVTQLFHLHIHTHTHQPTYKSDLIFCLLLLQLLLCVGQFFGTTVEAEEEWQQYKSGAKKGKERSLQVTSHFIWPLVMDIQSDSWMASLNPLNIIKVVTSE